MYWSILKQFFLAWLLCLEIFIGISIYSVGDINKDRFEKFREQMKSRKFKLGSDNIYYEESRRSELDTIPKVEIPVSVLNIEPILDTLSLEIQSL